MVGCLVAHLEVLSIQPAGRALIGSFARNRLKSSDNSVADEYRLVGSLFKHLAQIVSKSRGVVGTSCRTGIGSLSKTWSSVSITLAA